VIVKILLGVDDSRHSRAAIDFITTSSWPRDTHVIVLSASPRFFVGPGEAASPAALEKIMEEQAAYHRDLAKMAEQRIRTAGLKSESRMVQGDPRDALIETARQEHVDLIVVGSHGRTGLSKLLLGSVATHVVSHAHCNVLVVKLPAA
jgi:nucleotide-binding universal stress UspA family protein